MYIYLVSQHVNNDYDTFDAIVVCAKDEEDAKLVKKLDGSQFSSWVGDINDLEVKLVGTAIGLERGIVLESYNAG